jgi:pilus assembly protein CpaF
MLQAMNTGHDGSLSTAHANSCTDLLGRLEMMVLMGMELPLSAIRRQIASGVDIIVQLGRLRDKSRRVLEITEVCGMEQGEIVLNPLYRFAERGEENGKIRGRLEEQGTLKNQSKLSMAGIVWEETKEAENVV